MILEKDEFIEMFEYDKFFIPDEILDDYIPNPIKVDGDLELTKEDLLEYRKTTRTLEISGRLISINKVLRVLSSNKTIKEAIFSNMNLDMDTYQEMESTLVGKAYFKQN